MVRESKKVCGIRDRYLNIGCIYLTVCIGLLRIGMLGIPNWYYQGKDLKKWEGGLFSVNKSGGLIKEENYKKLSNDYCAEKTRYGYLYMNLNLSYYEVDSMCRKFRSLSDVSRIFVGFTVLTSFTKIIRIIFMLQINKMKDPQACIFFFVFLDLLLEFSSVVLLGAAPKVTLRGDCHYLSRLTDSTYDLNTCGDLGSSLNILVTFLSLLFDILLISLIIAYSECSTVIAIESPERQ